MEGEILLMPYEEAAIKRGEEAALAEIDEILFEIARRTGKMKELDS